MLFSNWLHCTAATADDDGEILAGCTVMPTEAKLGLVFGVGLTILVAIYFRPKEIASNSVNSPSPAAIKFSQPVPSQSNSIRK
jgi:hypothetical protein